MLHTILSPSSERNHNSSGSPKGRIRSLRRPYPQRKPNTFLPKDRFIDDLSGVLPGIYSQKAVLLIDRIRLDDRPIAQQSPKKENRQGLQRAPDLASPAIKIQPYTDQHKEKQHRPYPRSSEEFHRK